MVSTRRVTAWGRAGLRRPVAQPHQVVVVDFPENPCGPLWLERAEVVLAVGVVVGREVVEAAHAVEDYRLLVGGQGGDAVREE